MAAAIALIDARGLSAFSMRALGSALGTSAMAVYFHFPNKTELLAAVGRALVASSPALAPVAGIAGIAGIAAMPADDPRAMAKAILAHLRALYILHPNAYALVRAELPLSASASAFAAPDRVWRGLSPARAHLLRVMLVAAATEPPALDAELLSLFFG